MPKSSRKSRPQKKQPKTGPAPQPRRTVAVEVEAKSATPARPLVVKVGSMVRDRPTGLNGMITHMHLEMNGAIFYNFQPTGLNPQNGEPLKSIWAAHDRIEGGDRIPFPNIPVRVLGTLAEDMASGFNGMITSLTLHISGCVHVSIQPSRSHPKTGGHVAAHDFDIRRVKGPAIPVLTEAQREKSQEIEPSPAETSGPILAEVSSASSGPLA